jgi:hypothetical protein
MAIKGDVFTDIQSIADDAYLDIQPAADHEAVVHNIYYADDIEVYRYDGTNSILIASRTDNGCLAMFAFHVTNTDRIRVKNVSGGTQLIGYDGIYTKVS